MQIIEDKLNKKAHYRPNCDCSLLLTSCDGAIIKTQKAIRMEPVIAKIAGSSGYENKIAFNLKCSDKPIILNLHFS